MVFNHENKLQQFVFQYINKIEFSPIYGYFMVFPWLFHSYYSKTIL